MATSTVRTPSMNPELAGGTGSGAPAVQEPRRGPADGRAGGSAEQGAVLAAAFAALPVAAAVLDLDGSVLAWNRTAEALLGWSEEEVTGPRGSALIWDRLPAADDPARRHRPSLVWMRRRDGRRMRVEVRREPAAAGSEVRGTVLLISRPQRRATSRARRADPGAGEWSRSVKALVGVREGELPRRVQAAVAGALYLGTVKTGDRLPPIRVLAELTRASCRPVAAAYRELAADGIVELRSRKGTVVAGGGEMPAEPGCDSAEWLVKALVDAHALQMKVPHLADLVSRWTTSVPLACACLESSEDDLVALEEDVARFWGMEPRRVRVGEEGGWREVRQALACADVVVTTRFHASAACRALQGTRTPVVVARLSPRVVDTLTAALARGPVAAVVADPEFGVRLLGLRCAERLRVIQMDDAASLATLDATTPVLMTRAARQRCTASVRLLTAPSSFLVLENPEAFARILVRRNRDAERSLQAVSRRRR